MAKMIDLFDEKEITLCQSCIESKQHKEKNSTQDIQRAIQLLGPIYSYHCNTIYQFNKIQI